MGRMDKSEELMAWGYLCGTMGLAFYADAIGCGQAYGYTLGSVAEFMLGTATVVAGAFLLYAAGMRRKRMALASSDRRGRRVVGIGNASTLRALAWNARRREVTGQ